MAILATIGTALGTALPVIGKVASKALPVLKTVGKTALNGGKKLFQSALLGNSTSDYTPTSLFTKQLLGGSGGLSSSAPFVPNNSNVDFSQYGQLSPNTQQYLTRYM